MASTCQAACAVRCERRRRGCLRDLHAPRPLAGAVPDAYACRPVTAPCLHRCLRTSLRRSFDLTSGDYIGDDMLSPSNGVYHNIILPRKLRIPPYLQPLHYTSRTCSGSRLVESSPNKQTKTCMLGNATRFAIHHSIS